jgi:hypothetical protein
MAALESTQFVQIVFSLSNHSIYTRNTLWSSEPSRSIPSLKTESGMAEDGEQCGPIRIAKRSRNSLGSAVKTFAVVGSGIVSFYIQINPGRARVVRRFHPNSGTNSP